MRELSVAAVADGCWLEERARQHGRYESFVLDVVHAVDRRWATVPDRAHRVLAGNSEGAYAAANVALRHLRTFGAFEAWSGYYQQTASGVFKHASPTQLRANSPATVVTGLRASIARLPLANHAQLGARVVHHLAR